MNICVYCASSEKINKLYLQRGEEFGEAMGKRNHTLVFGGGKFGVMGAVDRGVKKAGGTVIGVVPRFIEGLAVIDTDCELIRTDTMRQRKQIMEDKSDAFIMLPGGIGTFEEFFEILTLKQLQRHTKPIVLFNINNYFDNLIQMLETAISQEFMSEECRNLFFISDSEEEVFNYLDNYQAFTYDKYQN